MLFVANFVFAGGGYTNANAAKIDLRTVSTTANYLDATQFNNQDYGTKTSSSYFHVRAAEAWVYKDGSSDITGGNFHYRIYKVGSSAPSFTNISFTYQEGSTNSGTTYQKWGNYAIDIDVLAGVNSIGSWKFECYWSAPTNGNGVGNPIYLNAGGSNYSFTFTADVTLNAELTHFTAVPQANSVLLSWATASETNNSHFEVERGADARTWAKVGEVKGNGSKSAESKYAFTDAQPTTGINYYRLKQVDTDGKFAYHKVVSVVMGKGSKVTIAPNPAHEQLQILGATEGGEASIFNVSGQLMMMVKNTTTLNVSALPSGVYQLRYQSENGETTLSRFVKQ